MDISLYCAECGEGFPLILLHGNGESGEYFGKQTEFFSSRYRVMAVDTRGHGRSPRGTAPFTLSRFADDLKAFLDEKRIGKAHILGFSDGGNIALLFALRYPDSVGKLILNGANLFPGGVKPTVQAPIVMEYGMQSFLSLFSRKAAAKRELLGLMVNEPRIRPEELSAIRVPTLVIAGTRDMIRTSHTELIARSIPGAELRLIEGNHFVAAGNSAAFNEAVAEFLSRGEGGNV